MNLFHVFVWKVLVQRGRVADCTLSLLCAGCSKPAGCDDLDSDLKHQANFVHELIGSVVIKLYNGMSSLMQHGGIKNKDQRSLPLFLFSAFCSLIKML
jgi:hypothetical protein